jgi:hypothetical protein
LPPQSATVTDVAKKLAVQFAKDKVTPLGIASIVQKKKIKFQGEAKGSLLSKGLDSAVPESAAEKGLSPTTIQSQVQIVPTSLR